MIKVYGIKNCDTMKKAFTFLEQKGVKYEFHNYKTEGIDAETIRKWLKNLPLREVVNTKSTTWKGFTDAQKASISDPDSLIKQMTENTSVIKRPLVDLGKEFLLGFNSEEWEKKFFSK